MSIDYALIGVVAGGCSAATGVATYILARRRFLVEAVEKEASVRSTAEAAKRAADALSVRCDLCGHGLAEYKIATARELAALQATIDGILRSFEQAEERLGRSMETMGADFRAGLAELGDRVETVANRLSDFTQALLMRQREG